MQHAVAPFPSGAENKLSTPHPFSHHSPDCFIGDPKNIADKCYFAASSEATSGKCSLNTGFMTPETRLSRIIPLAKDFEKNHPHIPISTLILFVYTYAMCRNVLHILFFATASVFAQPMPQADESFDAFKARYVAWYDTIGAEDQAWEEMEAIDQLLDEQLDGFELRHDPSDDDWEASAAFVREHSELLDRIRGYSGKAYLGLPPGVLFDVDLAVELPKAIGLVLPNLGATWPQTKLLMIDSILAGQDGDHDRVLADIQAARRLQRFVPVSGAMIELLVEIAISNSVAAPILSGEIDLSGWSQQEIDRLATMYGLSSFDEQLIRVGAFERWGVGDILSWLYEGAKDGRISLRGVKRFIDMNNKLGTLDGDSFTSDSVEGASALVFATILRPQFRPYSDQIALANEIFRLVHMEMSTPSHELKLFQSSVLIDKWSTQETKPFEYAPAVLAILDFSRMYRRAAQAQAVESATVILIALHRHHRKHGEFPATLGELDHDLLASGVPTDPHSGQPIRYMLVDGQPMIYSFGPDRDDDGGRRILDADGEPEAYPRFLTLDEFDALDATELEAIDGDWVLYPAVR